MDGDLETAAAGVVDLHDNQFARHLYIMRGRMRNTNAPSECPIGFDYNLY